MRILWKWLTELVEIQESVGEVAERLTRAGLEVEAVSPYRRLPKALDTLVVGEIIQVEKHPAADRLWVCRVRISSDREVSIVTGATNISVGVRVPVALPGSLVRVRGEWVSLEARSFRGIRSEGMLCSATEMAIGEEADGIYLFPSNTPIGRPVAEVLGDYEDTVLEISVTPNRGDALSHWGIAREYAALTGAALHLPSWKAQGHRFPMPLLIEVSDAEACPRYGGVYVRGVGGQGQTPAWMKYRLEAAGFRSIHPVVDVTNYVLIGFGQPLHAFDGDQLEGKTLRIAPLEQPVEMEGLQGQTLCLEKGDIVISDGAGPACLAGLLGGKRTAITEKTQAVFIESAYFSPSHIRRTGRRLGLHTESGYRFMRGTDPDRVPWGAEAAAALLQQIYPNAEVSTYAEVHAASYTAPRVFTVSLPALRKVTGLPLLSETTQHKLERLDIRIHPLSDQEWEVQVPRYRLDVTRPADIAEELLRIEGWEALPAHLPQPPAPYPQLTPEEVLYELKEALCEFLTGLGLEEVRTNSLVARTHFPPDLSKTPIRLANPLYEELAYLRPTLIGSGLEVLAHNKAHGAEGFWAFEWGRVYFQEGEEARLALWGWGKAPLRKLDSSFAPAEALPAMVRALLQRAGTPWEEKPFLHPQGVWQRGVEVFQGETRLGTVGALNDTYLHSFGLAGQEVWAAELSEDFLRMPLRRLPHFGGLSYHPGVVKDLSLYVPDGLNYAELVAAFRKMEHPYLRDIQPFDKYTDPQGRRSYGIRFYLQADHTLTEGEIHDFLRRAIAVAEALGAQVRKAAGE